MTNLLLSDARMETGGISKIGRGRHTTRHSEIFHISGRSYLMDTPGFTSMNLPELEKKICVFIFRNLNRLRAAAGLTAVCI